MKSLFGCYDIHKVVENSVPELPQNATDVQKVAHKEATKKDCKVACCI